MPDSGPRIPDRRRMNPPPNPGRLARAANPADNPPATLTHPGADRVGDPD